MLFMLTSTMLFLSTVACAQTIATPQKPLEENVKTKRQLSYYEDIIGPPPPAHHINNLVPIVKRPAVASPFQPNPYNKKYTNVFGYNDINYQHIFNGLNGYGYPIIPTHFTPPAFETPSIFANGYGYVNYGASRDFDTAYIAHDGRILKQYAVHEQHNNDLPDPVSLRPRPAVIPGRTVMPAQIPLFRPNNFAQPRSFNVNGNDVPTFLNKNHGPIALGSGSIGVVRGANGEVFLGSGSLGYISHTDHYNNVVDLVNRRQTPLPRGPTNF